MRRQSVNEASEGLPDNADYCHFCTDPSNYRKKRYDGFAQFLLEINFNLEDPAEKMYSLDSIPMLATLFGPQVPFHDCRLRIIDSREIATFAIN